MTTSKLWRTFGADLALFEVHSPDLPGDGYLRDEQITSLSIDAGTTMAGLSTSAAEVKLSGYHALDYSTDKPIRIDLSYYGRNLLAGLLGVPADLIRDRFRGRIAGQKVTDNGASGLTSSLTAQDWGAFIAQLERGGYGNRDEPDVARLYRSMFVHSGVPGATQLEQWGSTWHWIKWPDGEESNPQLLFPTSDIIGKYAADLGNFISVPRNGVPRAWSHDHLVALADDWRQINPHPLQRSQVLKPVEWTRDVTIPEQLQWQQWTGIGSTTSVVFTFPPPNDIVHRVETLDMLHIWDIQATPTSSGLRDVMWARVVRASATDLAVEKVSLDVLGLVRRNIGTDRSLVGQILTMNHGDPIALGWDWPDPVNGVYFAQRVAHTITPDSWTVDLDLVPALHVTGFPSTLDLAGQTWATGYPPATQWEAPTTTWEASP